MDRSFGHHFWPAKSQEFRMFRSYPQVFVPATSIVLKHDLPVKLGSSIATGAKVSTKLSGQWNIEFTMQALLRTPFVAVAFR
jgi:hypothetical protein